MFFVAQAIYLMDGKGHISLDIGITKRFPACLIYGMSVSTLCGPASRRSIRDGTTGDGHEADWAPAENIWADISQIREPKLLWCGPYVCIREE